MQVLDFKIGEKYIVPCAFFRKTKSKNIHHKNGKVKTYWHYAEIKRTRKTHEHRFVPIIDHPHNDIENGQPIPHYHHDSRFICTANSKSYNEYLSSNPTNPLRVPKKDNLEIRYIECIYIGDHITTTPVELIKHSKLKHNCIHKNKCPHRGFDLSNVKPVDGIITCPLHGLKFDAETKQLVNTTLINTIK